ncbi:MAG: phosphatase PAP2 family protein [Planctomycetota bacterium]
MSHPDHATSAGRPPLRDVLLPFAASLACIGALYTGDLDTQLTARFFDEARGVWPFRDRGTWPTWIHRGVTDLVFLTALSALVVAVRQRFKRADPVLAARATLLVATIASTTLIVALLKSVSPDPSPWDATTFGGAITHGKLFQSSVPPGHTGHASPGAHASGVFALMALYYCWCEAHLTRARIALVAAWLAGSAAGVNQVLRGAHYPSHNYWSALLAWAIATTLYFTLFRGKLGARDTPR